MPSQDCPLGRCKYASNMERQVVLQLAGKAPEGGKHVGCGFWLIAHCTMLHPANRTDRGDLQQDLLPRIEGPFWSSCLLPMLLRFLGILTSLFLNEYGESTAASGGTTIG
jgi:hypothetical protein